MLRHFRFDFGQHLEDIEDLERTIQVGAELAAQAGIGQGRNAALAGAAEIDGQAVGGFMPDGVEDAFARGHRAGG
jgi:hypothetical protein